MLKVKIIEKDNQYDLQDAVNRWLYDNCNYPIVDIKYSGCGAFPPYSIHYYSAMIIYKER